LNVRNARWKLVSLWFSQTARVTADNALRFWVCLDYAAQSDAHKNNAWYLVNVIFTLPAIVLAPFNGAICNSLPKSRVLHATALYGFAVMGTFLILGDHWLACWALIAIGSAIYGPTRYAMLPAAAVDTHWSLTRINGFIEMGTFSAILAGLILIVGTDLGTSIGAIILVTILNGVAWLTAMPVAFPSDLRRDEPAWDAVRDFFSDFRRIWSIREARICLLGLSGKRGLVIGMSGAMIAILFGEGALNLKFIAIITCWVAGGVAVGSLLAGLQKHPRRVLGLVPVGGLGFTLGLMYAAESMVRVVADSEINVWFCAVVGLCAGLINVPLAATYQAAVPDDARGNAMAIRNMMDYVCFALVGISLGLLGRYAGFDGSMQLWLVAGTAGGATLAAWWFFRREVWEQLIEFFFAIMYRFRVAGPGLDQFPLKGPVIVVANHSSWLDPMWLAKVLPRTMIPMMTSVFFDHWLLRWTMIYLADAIRVEAAGFRRAIPELQKAIDSLDAGKCLVIFPEGRLRRNQEQPLKLFGQGIWHILRERPNTPVVVCWIEGGWGSFFSYFNGPPTKNKPFDLGHPLGIAVGEPRQLGEEILADHRKTRQYLMEQCLAARSYFGLEPLVVQPTEVEASEER
jgi:acyl-[acyl-carrier-protein]-phospholipid O-acyltransferase/long-chain-fatty-acid--[acyl-carrier-protein] ligase